MVEKSIISKEDCQTLFSNVSVILSVNKEVARLFETRSDEEKDGPLLVGDIFLKMVILFNSLNKSLNNKNNNEKSIKIIIIMMKTSTTIKIIILRKKIK